MDSASSRRAPGGLLVGGGLASDARGAGCSRTRTQRGTDVLQASAVLAGVMPAEQQLAAGAQQRPYLRSCAAASALVRCSICARALQRSQQSGPVSTGGTVVIIS